MAPLVALLFVTSFLIAESKISVHYEGFGTFHLNDFYDIEYRPVTKLPESPEEINPDFRLFTRKNSAEPNNLKYNSSEELKKSNFDGKHKTKIFAHGYLDDAKSDWWVKLKDEFLKYDDYNVIAFDWSNGNRGLYSQAVANTRIVGMMIGKFIEMAVDETEATLDSFHVLGHSLGGHVAGYAGKYLNGKLGQITGLDPAGPFYEGLKNHSAKLWYTDAKFVEVIHVDVAGLLSKEHGLGINETCGDVDVFINGGHKQPGCDNGTKIIEEEGLINGVIRYFECDHLRAVDYYTEAINHHDRYPNAYVCDNYQKFKDGKCSDCGDYRKGGKKCFTLSANSREEYSSQSYSQGKRFYMMTSGTSPFFKKQMKISVKVGEKTDVTGRFKIKFQCSDEVQVEVPEKDKHLSGKGRTEYYRKVVVLPCNNQTIEKIEFQWTSDKSKDKDSGKKLYFSQVLIKDLSNTKYYMSTGGNKFENPNPEDGILIDDPIEIKQTA